MYTNEGAVIVDSNYRTIATVQTAGNVHPVDMHEFQLLNDGESALVVTYQTIPYDLTAYGVTSGLGWLQEAVFQEILVGTGEVLYEWYSSMHVDPSEGIVLPGESDIVGDGAGPHSAWDYLYVSTVSEVQNHRANKMSSHINSVEKSPDSGDYMISARHTSTIVSHRSHKDD